MKSTNRIEMAELAQIKLAVEESWEKVAPFWPLKNIIAVNPLLGFEHLSFEEALIEAEIFFQQKNLPKPIEDINRESIKWLQVFFDTGQATIKMPLRRLGLLKAVLRLLPFDKKIYPADERKIEWMKSLAETPECVIAECLRYLGILSEDYMLYMTLMLTTLPGWAAYIQYRTSWADTLDEKHDYPVTKAEYLALRLIITCLLWNDAKILLDWHMDAKRNSNPKKSLSSIERLEDRYKTNLLDKLAQQKVTKKNPADVQFIFCIDARSEPFRRALEAEGHYETFGFAGFFGVPVSIDNEITGESYHSCPVLLKPVYRIKTHPAYCDDICQKGYERMQGFKRLYQSLKYTFTTPFTLVETLGIASGIWMAIRSIFPSLGYRVKSTITQKLNPSVPFKEDIESIPFEKQCYYAATALRMMGLTDHFAELVVLCGHGSLTQNNAYATALDCGACGGRHGAANARILTTILNNRSVRYNLKEKENIIIPDTTHFLAAEHNTTTDEVEIYTHNIPEKFKDRIISLKMDLQAARNQNSQCRAVKMGWKGNPKNAAKHTALRAHDWAQVRPEWGLAQNAAFIVGPRTLTREIDLDGRSFLHSYDWQLDKNGVLLATILTAPMIVAQWINSQYLFSTLDNVAFGGGGKITKNITGKMGIMQGNASDLMHGLPLQSVFKTDYEHYHQTLRLITIIYAPRILIDEIIAQQEILQKLFGNGWVTLACIEPKNHEIYTLKRDLKWMKAR
jgi:uncharacterized protein YbcC (UPF0753/DUF2309 family)